MNRSRVSALGMVPWPALCPRRRARAWGPPLVSVQELPGRRSIETAHPYAGNRLGLEVSGVYADPAGFVHAHGFPVRDASTRGAPDEAQALVAPGVASERALLGADRDVTKLVVRPKSAV